MRKLAHAQAGAPQGKSSYWDEHELENPRLGVRLEKQDWEWADRDDDSVVWAEKGCIYRAAALTDGLGPAHMLFDANPLRFTAIPAPY
ncbi:MAG: hypothetical protein EXQ47_04475 [Bryobacterales bacterium]|nr:hypothetical protein [Bryobacterales bacterium]